jgi:hypothetical protein
LSNIFLAAHMIQDCISEEMLKENYNYSQD